MKIHIESCENCPSANHGPDPFSIDIKEHYSRKAQIDSAFPCAWRDEKLCKGYCDFLDLNEVDFEERMK